MTHLYNEWKENLITYEVLSNLMVIYSFNELTYELLF